MSFHGALGNMIAADQALAADLVRAVVTFDPKLILLTSARRAQYTPSTLHEAQGRSGALTSRIQYAQCTGNSQVQC